MVINKYWKSNIQMCAHMRREAIINNFADIYDKYHRPSVNKVRAYNALKHEYSFNDTMILGIPCKSVKVPYNMHKLNNTMYLKYRGDIGVINASCHQFTTIATFEDVETNKIYVVKETKDNTYMCALVD